jgi:hypothetical protein
MKQRQWVTAVLLCLVVTALFWIDQRREIAA